MNDKAKKMARRAELEDYLLHLFYKGDRGTCGEFVEWLEYQATEGSVMRILEATELIALYEEG